MKLNYIYDSLINIFLVKGLGKNKEIIVPLGTKGLMQKYSPLVRIPTSEVWRNESTKVKLKSFITLKWLPSEKIIIKLAMEPFYREIFGGEEDFATPLLQFMSWHNDQTWDFSHLQEKDLHKIDAIESLIVSNRIRYRNLTSPHLNLKLGKVAPLMCILIFPMLAKIPIRSIQYFIDIHHSFAFNSIRKSGHKSADDLISFLYEISFILQKTAVSFLEFIILIDTIEKNKKNNILHPKEIDAIIKCETIISYLKATFEKIIAFIGCVYNISGLDSKKNHKAKLILLKQKVVKTAQNQPYYQLIMELVSSESLQNLNNYRNGIFHKKGISDLQPHNYVSNNKSSLPLRSLYFTLHKEYEKCSIVLIGALALLTDELIKLDLPTINMAEIPKEEMIKFFKNIDN